MSWLEWLAVVAVIVAVFIAWDRAFCAGRRCEHLAEREPPLGHAGPK
jgi:hypothetical protein